MSFTPEYPTLGKFSPQLEQLVRVTASPDPEELKAAYQQIKRLEADLLECREYLERDMDVVDGDYGQQSPNRAMQLVSMIDESLHGPGNF